MIEDANIYFMVLKWIEHHHAGESLRFLASDWLRNGSWARGSVPGGSATVSLPLAIYFFSVKNMENMLLWNAICGIVLRIFISLGKYIVE